ncbi:hypothetical protein AAEU32_13595 [Pseudoalteromonas sp. SSDWG2]|uniref:hypothetical protein n=1 Tax=Pseudoalteromonas sp. SSDWG2 TaxID=3139391 RepID=UPI003BAC1145
MYKYSCANGAYQLKLMDKVIVGEFSGAINERMMASFVEQIAQMVQEHNLSQWGYIGDSLNVPAATPEAQQHMVDIGNFMYSKGCKAIAFVLHSPIAINQLDKIRKQMGRTNDTRDIIFDNLDDALVYVNSFITQ